jgi:cytochrome P450
MDAHFDARADARRAAIAAAAAAAAAPGGAAAAAAAVDADVPQDLLTALLTARDPETGAPLTRHDVNLTLRQMMIAGKSNPKPDITHPRHASVLTSPSVMCETTRYDRLPTE